MQIPLAASLPTSSLESLADLRNHHELQIVVENDRAWIVWNSPNPSLAHRLMAIPNSQLFSKESAGWTLIGNRVPSFGLPIDLREGQSLVHEIIPASLEPITPTVESTPAPIALRLVRDESFQARPATVLIADLDELSDWADSAVSSAFNRLSAARSGRTAIVRGYPLPPIIAAWRFWGVRVLCPMGFQILPALPESTLLKSLMVENDHILIFHKDHVTSYETVPLSAFAPLSRASIRIAMLEFIRP